MGIFKKNKVPDELPELALDDLESGNKEVHDHLKKEEVKNPPAEPAKAEEKTAAPEAEDKEEKTESKPAETAPVETEEKALEEAKPAEESNTQKTEIEKVTFSKDEKSFFGDLQENLNSELSNLNKLEGWYKDRFEKRDVIKEMKDYWKGKKSTSVIGVLKKNFREKISPKILRLQELEKAWQETYFELIEKEEEIKAQELELKELMSGFVKLCRKKTRDLKHESALIDDRLKKAHERRHRSHSKVHSLQKSKKSRAHKKAKANSASHKKDTK